MNNNVQQLLSELKAKGLLRLEGGLWKLSSAVLEEVPLTAAEQKTVEWCCLVENKFKLHQKYPAEYLTKAQLKGIEKYAVMPLLSPSLVAYVNASQKALQRRRYGVFFWCIMAIVLLGIMGQ